jgi:HrpA-like RNA helicase
MASSDSTASDAAPLPARDPGFAQQLLRELEGNRVVMVAGGTGSGKSSQIPQLLLDQLGGAVLVTQPRRLAAVAISQWVAEQRGCRLGSEVGYHIGQQRCASRVTRLLFATCGLSLELLRTNGPAALEPYSVVVLDEVHERSSESDLVLACIRRYMARELPRLKLVLMSATFRADIYREFFADLGGEGERIKLVHVPQLQQDLASRVLGQHELRTAERYLDDAINRAEQLVEQQRLGLLSGLSPSFASMETAQFRALERSMCRPGSRNAKDVESLRPGAPDTCTLHQLVCCLIASIEQGIQPPLLTRRVGASSSRMDVARTTLVFLPTYRSLEELHGLLSGLLPGRLALSVLHSSVDLTECLKAIQNQSSGSTHNVILATNLAESSLTIAGVSTVIDYCRCNQIHWQHESKLSTAKTVWASQSQCDQRRGRTGRTCSGTVFRLVPRVAYDRCCPRWEPPELSLSSLHSESLLLLTSAHRAMRNAVDLLAGTLDPPPAAVVEAAHRYLSNIGAIKARSSSRRRSGYEATPYGQALAALPLSLEGARLVLLGAAQGFLREASLLGSIMTTTPAPITKPFGDRRQHEQNLKSYGGDAVTPEDKVGSLMAQLSAFEWWQSQYVDVQRLRRLGICIICRRWPSQGAANRCELRHLLHLPRSIAWLGPAAQHTSSHGAKRHLDVRAYLSYGLHSAVAGRECLLPNLPRNSARLAPPDRWPERRQRQQCHG